MSDSSRSLPYDSRRPPLDTLQAYHTSPCDTHPLYPFDLFVFCVVVTVHGPYTLSESDSERSALCNHAVRRVSRNTVEPSLSLDGKTFQLTYAHTQQHDTSYLHTFRSSLRPPATAESVVLQQRLSGSVQPSILPHHHHLHAKASNGRSALRVQELTSPGRCATTTLTSAHTELCLPLASLDSRRACTPDLDERGGRGEDTGAGSERGK
ncbi:hypothetical protein BV20DRAFT_151100 [Pilatotrama ljubarskyi]|nr:hypothetical protein BV20DRAFT_151100 [Pilatotrama ljubarskyi]